MDSRLRGNDGSVGADWAAMSWDSGKNGETQKAIWPPGRAEKFLCPSHPGLLPLEGVGVFLFATAHSVIPAKAGNTVN